MTPSTLNQAGASVTLFGSNFGLTTSNVSAVSEGTIALPSAYVSDTALTMRSSTNYGNSLNVQVTMGRVAFFIPSQLFSYDAPSVTNSSLAFGGVTGGEPLSLTGANFGLEEPPSWDILLGASVCAERTWVSDSSVGCRTPPGTGRNHAVRVVRGTSGEPYTRTPNPDHLNPNA